MLKALGSTVAQTTARLGQRDDSVDRSLLLVSRAQRRRQLKTVFLLGIVFVGMVVVFSALFLWTASPDTQPPVPEGSVISAMIAAVMVALASVAVRVAALANKRGRSDGLVPGLVAGVLAMGIGGAALVSMLPAAAIWPTETAYNAIYWMFVSWTGFHVVTGTILVLFILAKAITGKVGPERRQSLQNVELFWHFTTGIALLSLVMVQLWPRMI